MNQSQLPGCREWGSPLWAEQPGGEFANPTDTVKLKTGECNILQISKLEILWIVKEVPPKESYLVMLLCYIYMIWMNECVGAWLPGVANQIRERGDIYWSLMLETAFYSGLWCGPGWWRSLDSGELITGGEWSLTRANTQHSPGMVNSKLKH